MGERSRKTEIKSFSPGKGHRFGALVDLHGAVYWKSQRTTAGRTKGRKKEAQHCRIRQELLRQTINKTHGPYSGPSEVLIIHCPPPPYFPFCCSVAGLTSCQYQTPEHHHHSSAALAALFALLERTKGEKCHIKPHFQFINSR